MFHVIGNLGDVGGARTELWHSLRLWRRGGIGVTLWTVEEPSGEWRHRACDLGVRVEPCSDGGGIPSGALVAGWCESMFWILHDRLKAKGCRTVWVGCMTEPSITEWIERQTADVHVYQSVYQHGVMAEWHRKHTSQEPPARLIRGAFDLDLYPWRPKSRDPDGTFTVGMLARDDSRKWPATLWDDYGRIGHAGLRARVMGVGPDAARLVGPLPSWAEMLPPGAEPSVSFIRSLDCMVIPPVAVAENWPRVGLEAAAVGVPLVVEDRGGWREMIAHGETGFLYQNIDAMARYAERLGHDEPFRRWVIESAREELEAQHANADAWLDDWRDLIGSL